MSIELESSNNLAEKPVYTPLLEISNQSRRSRRRLLHALDEPTIRVAFDHVTFKRFNEARILFELCTKNAPHGSQERFSAQWGLGNICKLEGDIEAAIRYYIEAVVENPEHSRENHFLQIVALMKESPLEHDDTHLAAVLTRGLASLDEKGQLRNRKCNDCSVGDQILKQHRVVEEGGDRSTRSRFFQLLGSMKIMPINKTAHLVSNFDHAPNEIRQ